MSYTVPTGVVNGNADTPTRLRRRSVDRVHPDLTRVRVDRALDRDRGLGAAAPPVRRHRCRRRHPRARGAARARDRVHAGRHPQRRLGDVHAEARVGAGVLLDVEVVREEVAVARAAEGDGLRLRPAVVQRDHALAAGLGPPGGAPDAARDPRRHDVLGIVAELRPEPAADIRRDHVHHRGLEAEDRLQTHLHRVGRLHAEPVVQPAVGIPGRRGRTGLEGAGGHARVGEQERDDHVATVEQAFGVVADRVGLGDVVVEMLEHRRALGEHVVLDHHQLGRVHSHRRRVRDDDRDRLADVAHDVAREQRE